MNTCETKICRVCEQTKPIVKFDQMLTKKEGKIRRHTCRDCTSSGNGHYKTLKDLQSQNLKKCHLCKEIKQLDHFYKQESSYDGYMFNCKECWKDRNKQWVKNHSEKVSELQKKYYNKNKETIKKRVKDWKNENKDYVNSQRALQRKQNPSYKIGYYIRTRLYKLISRDQKVGSFVRDLGCSVEELKQHLESKFYPNPTTGEQMSWENYGQYGWHIDHIIPLCSFDLTNREQFLKACHFLNLQPLWAEENLKKGAKN